MPSPASSSGPVTTSAPAPEFERGQQGDDAEEQQGESDAHDPSGGSPREDPGYADGAGQERDREGEEAHPRRHCGETEGDREKKGDDEEQTRLQQELEEERREPGLEPGDPEHAGVDQGGLMASEPSAFPQDEEHEHGTPTEEQPDHRGRAQPLGRIGLRLHEAPGPGADHAVDDHGEAGGGQQRTDRIKVHTWKGWRVGHAPREEEDAENEDHFTDEDPSPAEVGGEQPADERSHRDGDGTCRRHQAIRPRSFEPTEVRRNQRHHRGHDQCGTEPLQDRPPDDEHGE